MSKVHNSKPRTYRDRLLEDFTFGENGVAIEIDDDYAEHEKARSRIPEVSVMTVLILTFSTAIVALDKFLSSEHDSTLWVLLGLLLVTATFIIVGTLGCFREAALNDEVGSKLNQIPRPAHITGLGASVAIILFGFVLLVLIIGELRPNEFNISARVGNWTILLLAGLFGFAFLSSRLPVPQSLDEFLDKLRNWTKGVRGIGRAISSMDAILVFGIAPLVGVSFKNWYARYPVLMAHLACCGFLVWNLPSPLGLISALWVFILVFAVVRRWGWIEHARASRLQNPDDPQRRRIRSTVDLRDEAMFSLILLVLIMPLAMRQVHQLVPLDQGFSIKGESINNLFAWTGFFGVELLKALPFVDWADIYGARSSAGISTSGPISMHAVFVARMIIDLVFLAALVQSVSISVAIEKNKRDFLANRNGVTRLDERIERSHLRRLVFKNAEQAYKPINSLEAYIHYDSLALSRLKLRYRGDDERLIAAILQIGELSNREITTPSEVLVELAHMPQPKGSKLLDALKIIEEEKDFDADHLFSARAALNWKGNLESERQALVQLMMTRIPPTPERDEKFAEILGGNNYDSLLGVRRLVIDTLARNAHRNPKAVIYLTKAVSDDASDVVRKLAEKAMNRFGLQPPVKSNSDDELLQSLG